MSMRLIAAGLLLASLTSCAGESGGARFEARGAWARPTPATATTAVVYLSVTSDVDDELPGAEVDATVAEAISLHATTIGGDGGALHDHSGDGADDVASMQEMGSFPLRGGETLAFEPGGNHLMLENLARPLSVGEQFDVELLFASGRTLRVDVTVGDNPPS